MDGNLRREIALARVAEALSPIQGAKARINELYNESKANFNRHKINNHTKRKAAAFRVQKNIYQKLFGIPYSRDYMPLTIDDLEIIRRHMDTEPSLGFKAILNSKNTNKKAANYMDAEIQKELDSGVNMFANFRGPAPATSFAQLPRVSLNEINNLEINNLGAELEAQELAALPASNSNNSGYSSNESTGFVPPPPPTGPEPGSPAYYAQFAGKRTRRNRKNLKKRSHRRNNRKNGRTSRRN